MDKPQSGDIAVSLCGRDSGRRFFILEASDPFCILADGKLRTLEKPKKKKNKHLKWLSRPQCRVSEKLQSGEKVTNRELRRALAEINETEGAYGEG